MTSFTSTTLYKKRKTKPVYVGSIAIGGDNPVRVQSMITTPLTDVDAAVAEIEALAKADCEIIRFTVPTRDELNSLPLIKDKLKEKNITTPLVADIHYTPSIAMDAVPYVEKVRINPGNFVDKKLFKTHEYDDKSYEEELKKIDEKFIPLIEKCKEHNVALRIGTNHGSLSDRIMSRYGDTPEGMVESALEFTRIAIKHGFDQLVFSMKSSNVRVMIQAYRLLAQKLDEKGWNFPFHLGVTEAGDGDEGRIKSAVGIGTLLMDGIGDTIRVSLTEDAVYEIPAAYSILQACRLRMTKPEYIMCPMCGRTEYDLKKVAANIKERTSHLKGLKIGIMGCIVNGPGEMADADFGYVGIGKDKVSLYVGQECIEKGIPEEKAVDKLINLIKENGKWVEQ